ncbi:LysR family transcriptional regulator [Kitasatospora aureofaciens]|uniref:LysR family transcriptional regulator n=1 Tax=Kitasatospora aureofaciens TaxID=1894 RepID=A0A1E7MWG4_KITAU|nr:LysR family transcriptional regulator [Kitasatospora aureofaciens]
MLSTERFTALVPEAHPLADRAELSATELSAADLLTWPHQINSGLCDRLLSAFRIGGADLRIIRTADNVHAIAAHVAAGTGIGITVESALDHRPPGLRVIPLTGPSTTADQVVLTPTAPSEPAAALRDLLLHAAADATPEPATLRVD